MLEPNYSGGKEMKTRMVGLLSVLGLFLVLTFCPVLASAGPLVSIQPADSQVGVGESFDVFVDISGVNGLYAFQFDILFNPTVLSATSITEGSLLPTGGATIFIPGTIDNAAGTISYTADSLVSSVSGVSGDGHLAELDFQGVGQGTSDVTLSNLVFLDSFFYDITPSSISGGSVTVGPAASVPEPCTVFLLGMGLAGAGTFRLFRRRFSAN
jgi:general secretion pathway protein D